MGRPQKKKSSQNERGKLLLAIALGAVLLGIVLWPEDESALDTDSSVSAANGTTEDAADNGSSTSSTLNAAVAKKHSSHLPPRKSLPRLDHEVIAAQDPFLVPAAADGEVSGEASLLAAQNEPDSGEATTVERWNSARISAVYQTAEGAMALIDGRLVPVRDPRAAIQSLRGEQ